MLKRGYPEEVIDYLCKSSNPSVPDNQINKIYKEYNILKRKLKDLINNFTVYGLFCDEHIDNNLFHKGSTFNHSCRPNTLIL